LKTGDTDVTVTQKQIARRVGLDVSSVNKILNRRPGAVFGKETVKRVFKVARQLGYDFDRLKHAHRRRHARKNLGLPVEFSVYLQGGQLFDRGTGVLKEVSLSGARLSAIVLPGTVLPTLPHSVGVRLRIAPDQELEILGHPVRFTEWDGAMGVAIEFHQAEAAKAKQLVSMRA
jgi:transcriptional regulator with XRE-family HTH domain